MDDELYWEDYYQTSGPLVEDPPDNEDYNVAGPGEEDPGYDEWDFDPDYQATAALEDALEYGTVDFDEFGNLSVYLGEGVWETYGPNGEIWQGLYDEDGFLLASREIRGTGEPTEPDYSDPQVQQVMQRQQQTEQRRNTTAKTTGGQPGAGSGGGTGGGASGGGSSGGSQSGGNSSADIAKILQALLGQTQSTGNTAQSRSAAAALSQAQSRAAQSSGGMLGGTTGLLIGGGLLLAFFIANRK